MIAGILLIAITVVLVSVLYVLITLPLKPPAPTIQVTSTYNATNVVIYGEGNSPISANCPGVSGTCLAPGETFVVASVSGSIPLNLVSIEFYCNNAVATSGPLSSIENPATASSSGAGHASSALCPNQAVGGGSCSNYPAWVNAALVNLVYYLPRTPGQTAMAAGDEFVVYGSMCHVQIGSAGGGFFYGPPPECISGLVSCSIELVYSGQSSAILATLQLSP